MSEKSIGLRVREYRLSKGMTQEELAEKSGIDTNNLSRIERGISTPKLKTILSLAEALDITPNDLLLESYNAGETLLSVEIAKLIEGLTQDDYKKVIEYIRFLKHS